VKFTLSWLKEHLDTQAGVEEIADALTDLGLEVEEVINPADTLGAFRICRVIEARQHPDADRLRLCRVETWPDGPGGRTEEVQVVCGAPNARTGMAGVFAPVGTHIPGTGVDLKPGVIRGVESNGMLCSERELEVSNDHEGIIDLPADAPMGERFIDYAGLNDPVIDIAITPNRQDALGVRGIARDLAARGLGTLRPEKKARIEGTFESPIKIIIDEDTTEGGCEVFMGRLIRGVKNGPSPAWLQKRLKAIGLRPISALVDVTNFFTYDMNRPLHVFDADKVRGNLRVHRAKGGEKLVGLDEKEYIFNSGDVVISDDHEIESIAGIMGGLRTGCTEETTNVFLEAAIWDTTQIAHTGRALRINSDARYRNERGIDPAFNEPAIELATQMILELCGGEPSNVEVAGEVPDTTRAYRLDTDRVKSLVGMDIPAEEQRRTLVALGFTLKGDMAFPPSWRSDVQGEADLVEEVARIASLTRLVGKPLARAHVGVPRPVLTPMQKREGIARRAMAALGYNECVTYSFIDEASAKNFGGGTRASALDNPISSEMTHMRPSLLPGLLQAAARNQTRGFMDLALFEVGPVFHGPEPEEQETMVTGILVGHSGPRDRFGTRRPIDMFDAKADLEAVLAALGAPAKLMHQRGMNPWWHPGRSAKLTLGPKNVLGAFGELHPKVVRAAGIKGNVVAFAVHPANLPFPKARGATRAALAASDLQAVERDFAFVVGADVEAGALVNAAQGADKVLIDEVRVFDEFTGSSLGEGRKSLAITVRLQPRERTLTDEDIEAVSAKIVDKVAKATGGTLRG
jgi:phenylalanyl-tRNA synthetase beta chain